jgi:hypothetical protein
MPRNNLGAALIVAALLLIFLASGCASSSGGSAPAVQPVSSSGGINVKQVPMTPYMRSQVGTPNELSPLAPAQASNIRKVKGQWLCDINGQVYVFDGVSNWAPRQ